MRTDALLKGLRGERSLDDLPGHQGGESAEVYVEPADLVPMLDGYLKGKIAADKLQAWASWALAQEEFCVRHWRDDGVADQYEPMWNVLQELATPFLDGALSYERVRSFVSTLRAL